MWSWRAALERTEDDTAFQDTVTEFYREFGVGKFGLNKAFHINMNENSGRAVIEPITRVEHIGLEISWAMRCRRQS